MCLADYFDAFGANILLLEFLYLNILYSINKISHTISYINSLAIQ